MHRFGCGYGGVRCGCGVCGESSESRHFIGLWHSFTNRLPVVAAFFRLLGLEIKVPPLAAGLRYLVHLILRELEVFVAVYRSKQVSPNMGSAVLARWGAGEELTP